MARASKAAQLESQLKRHIGAIEQARKFRDHEGYDDLWKRMVDLYRGKHYAKMSKEDRMLVNLAFATKNVIAPSVAINNPKFVVNARKPEAGSQAVIAETVLNYLWRTNSYQDEFRLGVDDFLTIGHGWLKVGYRATKPREIIELPDAVEDNSAETEGVDNREPIPGNVETELVSFGQDDDRPFVERISPFDIFVDPDARHPKEMKWIAQRVRRPVVDVQVDSRYDEKARTKVTGHLAYQRIDDEDRVIDGEPRDPHFSYVDVYEFYDLRKGTVATFVRELEEAFLIEPAPIPFAFGHPFVMLRNYEVMDTFYPMGDLEAIEGLQHELNATRTQMMNHRKRYQRKVLIDKEAFEQEGLEALQSDADNTIVPVDVSAAVGGSLKEVIIPMPQEGTPPEFYNQSQQIEADINNVSGVSDYMRGAQAEIRRTATEAAMIQDAMNARAADKLARIESCLSKLGQRVVQLMQQFMTGERVVRIVGLSNQPVWLNFDADYIQGEFDFEVEGGSTQPRNESFRRQSALQLVDALSPFIGAVPIDLSAVVRYVLQFGFDIKDPNQFLMDPMMAQMQGMDSSMGGMGMGAPTPSAQQVGQSDPNVGMEMPEGAADSPIPGIPAELVAQLQGQMGLPAS